MKKLFPRLKKVVDIDLFLLKKMSRELGLLVKEGGFTPRHILCVERAGLLVGYELADLFMCKVSGIRASRYGTSLKSKGKIILRNLPRFMTHFLRSVELKSQVHDVNSARNVSFEFNELPPFDEKPAVDENILIVDDAIDTGHSLVAVINFLLEHGYSKENLKVAVLTTTGEGSVINADYSLLKNVICAFPWSYDSKQFDDTWRIYKEKKSIMALNIPYKTRTLLEKINRLKSSERGTEFGRLIYKYINNDKLAGSSSNSI